MEDKTRALSMLRELRDNKANERDKLAAEVDILDEILMKVARIVLQGCAGPASS